MEQLEKEAQRTFEAEELAARYKDELDTLTSRQQSSESVAPSNNAELEQLQVSFCAETTN